MAREENNEYGIILRIIDGYYYPLFTKNKWDEEKALFLGKKVLTCVVKELYPVAMHLISMVKEMADKEQKLLHREPSKIEKASGIDKLSVFSALSALDFLRDSLKLSIEEVMLTPYNECLVRFMFAKETLEYQERYLAEIKRMNEPKNKFK